MAIFGLLLKSIFLVALLVAVFIIGNRTTGGSRTTSGSSQTSDIYEELYDERPTQQANRKIFGKDEGDYVDFEEV